MLPRLLSTTVTSAAAAAAGASGVSARRAPAAAAVPAAVLLSARRLLSSSSSGGDAQSAESSAREDRMRALLQEKLRPTHLVIQDISGGCGAMYNMEVESPLFQGKPLVAQHRMVNEVLAKEIAEMHGLSLKTRPSK